MQAEPEVKIGIESRNSGRAGLEKLFSPRSVAIVGASESRHYSQSIIANLRQQGFEDSDIFPINPKYETISGLRCFASLDGLEEVPDAVAILVGHDQVKSQLELAGKIGAGAALVIADGYAEESEDGRNAQLELGDLARQQGIAMLGPNTLGYIIPASKAGMWCAGALQSPLRAGGVSVVAQSSGMLNVIMGMLGDRQIGVRACVSIGNAAMIGLPELVSHFAEDLDTRVIALVVESIDRPREFVEALIAAQRNNKPVVVLKIGASERGQLNSIAHIGRLSSPNQGWQAIFETAGVCQAFDIDEFLETITLFDGLRKEMSEVGAASGLGVAFATISGGETSLICDIADREGLALASLGADTLARLRNELGKATLIGNPLDLQNSRTTRPEAFSASLRTLASDGAVNVVAVRLNMSQKPSTSQSSLYREVFDLIRSAGAVPLVLSRAYERFDPSWWSLFRELGVTFVMSYRNAIAALAGFSSWLGSPTNEARSLEGIPSEAGVSGSVGSAPLSLAQARKWLSDSRIPYVPSDLADDAEAAVAIAEELGYPVVVKAVVPEMVHKSDAGGVALNLSDEYSVAMACREMSELLSPEGSTSGGRLSFEVQKMLPGGVEIIVGMKRDPTWGPLLVVGSGGIYTEILRDAVWGVPPVSSAEALRMLEKLRIWPVLKGARGQGPSDVDALCGLVSLFSKALVGDAQWIGGIDLNPVIVGPKGGGAYVVDVAMFGDEAMVDGWPV